MCVGTYERSLGQDLAVMPSAYLPCRSADLVSSDRDLKRRLRHPIRAKVFDIFDREKLGQMLPSPYARLLIVPIAAPQTCAGSAQNSHSATMRISASR
jgi:hypothetical protein